MNEIYREQTNFFVTINNLIIDGTPLLSENIPPVENADLLKMHGCLLEMHGRLLETHSRASLK